MSETLLNYEEAAERLRIRPDTLSRWVASGLVPHRKYFNKRVYFTEAHMEQIESGFERGVLPPRRKRRGR